MSDEIITRKQAIELHLKDVSKVLEGMVVNNQKSFESRKYSQTGTLSIIYEFERLGIKSPSIPTINRMFARYKLVNKKSEKQLKKGLS